MEVSSEVTSLSLHQSTACLDAARLVIAWLVVVVVVKVVPCAGGAGKLHHGIGTSANVVWWMWNAVLCVYLCWCGTCIVVALVLHIDTHLCINQVNCNLRI